VAYGDRLQVRVRSTGDFRFETRPEDEVDEIGIIVNNSIELNMDELHEALELDTRGIMVRESTATSGISTPEPTVQCLTLWSM